MKKHTILAILPPSYQNLLKLIIIIIIIKIGGNLTKF